MFYFSISFCLVLYSFHTGYKYQLLEKIFEIYNRLVLRVPKSRIFKEISIIKFYNYIHIKYIKYLYVSLSYINFKLFKYGLVLMSPSKLYPNIFKLLVLDFTSKHITFQAGQKIRKDVFSTCIYRENLRLEN